MFAIEWSLKIMNFIFVPLELFGCMWNASMGMLIKFQLLLHRVKFYKRLYFKSDLLYNVFWVYLLSDIDDSCCRTVFTSLGYTLPSIIYCYIFMSM